MKILCFLFLAVPAASPVFARECYKSAVMQARKMTIENCPRINTRQINRCREAYRKKGDPNWSRATLKNCSSYATAGILECRKYYVKRFAAEDCGLAVDPKQVPDTDVLPGYAAPAAKAKTGNSPAKPGAAASTARRDKGPAVSLDDYGDDRFAKLMSKSKVGRAKGDLSSVRSSIMIYYGEHEGLFPTSIKAMVPKYLKEIPEIALPGYQATRNVTVINSLPEKKDLCSLVRNTGGWIYIADMRSTQSGEFFIDSNSLSNGKPICSY
ncbi:MAG TPA: hypothetical protein DCZ92_10405 [Elusimicrobia bacterium]|nr:hypothetical protein [Elusimicrobiota bacterium]